ncbi:MAG: hypothetical protein E6J90_35370 [Deltaproteobacteria bacterium]|nr:MAG: hypothetical protein E6J90_35370 [Deltaproteobacteria bacterium]
MTTRQTTRLVDQLLAAADDRAREVVLAEAERMSAPAVLGPRRAPVTPGEAMIADAAALAMRAARLHARLLERPLASLGPEVARLVASRLGELGAVLGALCRAMPSAAPTSSTEMSHGA